MRGNARMALRPMFTSSRSLRQHEHESLAMLSTNRVTLGYVRTEDSFRTGMFHGSGAASQSAPKRAMHVAYRSMVF